MESRPPRSITNSYSQEGSERDRARVSVCNPSSCGDGAVPSERSIWRLFESYKRSAILHTEQYLQHNASIKSEAISSEDVDSLECALRNGGQVPKSFWDLKAARDNLLNDLEVLQDLSSYMLEASKKGLTKFYALIAFLTVTTSLSTSDAGNGSRRLLAPSIIALTAMTGYTGYRVSKYGAICLCSGVIDALLDRLERNALDEFDRDSLKGEKISVPVVDIPFLYSRERGTTMIYMLSLL